METLLKPISRSDKDLDIFLFVFREERRKKNVRNIRFQSIDKLLARLARLFAQLLSFSIESHLVYRESSQ